MDMEKKEVTAGGGAGGEAHYDRPCRGDNNSIGNEGGHHHRCFRVEKNINTCANTDEENAANSIVNKKDESYVAKLRSEDIGKLSRLCKMHLSFLLDLNSDKFETLLGENNEKDEQRRSVGNLFQKRNKSLKNVSSADGTSAVQSIEGIKHLIQFLGCEENLVREGLFRKSGNISRQKDLKDRLAACELLDFSLAYYTPHDCASVLKSFLSDLSEPLLLERLCNAHLSMRDIQNKQNRLKAVKFLLQMLPAENFSLAQQLFLLLHKVSREVERNKMSSDNLGAMFAPHLLCSKKMSASELQNIAVPMQVAISFIIQNASSAFEVPDVLALDVYTHVRDMNSVTSDTSECFRLSYDSLDSSGRLSNRKCRKFPDALQRNSQLSCDEPLNTVVAYAERGTCSDKSQTDVEIAKLYAHVQAMPESAKKKKLMKQFKEANGYSQQVEMKRKSSRAKSLGDSIRKKFNRHMRQKSGSMFTAECSSNDHSEDTSVSLVSNQEIQPENQLAISHLCESPYLLHRHNVHQQNSAQSKDLDSSPAVQSKVCAVPVIRKTLLPTGIKSSPPRSAANKRDSNSSQNTPPNRPAAKMRRIKECQLTPPRPKKPMVIVDSNIVV